VHLVVVDAFDPGGEKAVEFEQRRGWGELLFGQLGGAGVGDFDEELIPHAAKETFDLPPALWPVRGGMDQADPEFGACPQQPGVHEGAAVIHVGVGGNASASQCRFERGGQAHGVLGEPEPVTHREPRMIVQEREEISFSAADLGAVQRIPDPALVGCLGLEPAEHHGDAGGGTHQLAAVKQPQQRGLRRGVATRGPQDPGDLRGGAVGVLPLQCHRQL
jgi:hypothetical protein